MQPLTEHASTERTKGSEVAYRCDQSLTAAITILGSNQVALQQSLHHAQPHEPEWRTRYQWKSYTHPPSQQYNTPTLVRYSQTTPRNLSTTIFHPLHHAHSLSHSLTHSLGGHAQPLEKGGARVRLFCTANLCLSIGVGWLSRAFCGSGSGSRPTSKSV